MIIIRYLRPQNFFTSCERWRVMLGEWPCFNSWALGVCPGNATGDDLIGVYVACMVTGRRFPKSRQYVHHSLVCWRCKCHEVTNAFYILLNSRKDHLQNRILQTGHSYICLYLRPLGDGSGTADGGIMYFCRHAPLSLRGMDKTVTDHL